MEVEEVIGCEGPLQGQNMGAREWAVGRFPLNVDTTFSPFVRTSERQVDRVIDFASIQSTDILCDLGCGDASVLLRAAHLTACEGVGVEIDRALVRLGQQSILAANVAFGAALPSPRLYRVSIIEDLVENYVAKPEFSRCTVIFLHLVPDQLGELMPLLRQRIATGVRVIAQRFAVPGLHDLLFASLECESCASDEYFGTTGAAFLYQQLVPHLDAS
jgi:hypothetical protein